MVSADSPRAPRQACGHAVSRAPADGGDAAYGTGRTGQRIDAWVDTPGGAFALTTQRYAPDARHPDGASRSAPVSVDFGNDHRYAWGDHGRFVRAAPEHRGMMDGSTGLELAGGGAPPNGSAAQVGVVSDRRVLVTLKTDPDPGTVDVVALHEGAIAGAIPGTRPGELAVMRKRLDCWGAANPEAGARTNHRPRVRP